MRKSNGNATEGNLSPFSRTPFAGGPPALRHPIRSPPAFHCPRSGFHGFQCRFQPSPSRSRPRSGVRDVLVDSLLPHPSRSPSALARLEVTPPGTWRGIMENVWDFAWFLLSLSFAGGTPALPVVARFPVRFSSAARLGRRTLKKLSNVVQVVSFPSSFVSFVAGIPPASRSRKFFPIVGKRAENFSNHWKNRASFSNHWKIFFQSLENLPFAGEPADCAGGRVQR